MTQREILALQFAQDNPELVLAFQVILEAICMPGTVTKSNSDDVETFKTEPNAPNVLPFVDPAKELQWNGIPPVTCAPQAQEVFGGPVLGSAAPTPIFDPGVPPTVEPTRDTPDLVSLDSEGHPWDGRIHASTKTKIQKTGVWKLKRGVSIEVIAQVRSQDPASTAPQPGLSDLLNSNLIDPTPGVPAIATPSVPNVPKLVPVVRTLPAPPAVVPTAIPEPLDYKTVMKEIVERTGAGDYTPAMVWATLAQHGVANTGELMDQKVKYPAIWAALKALYVPA